MACLESCYGYFDLRLGWFTVDLYLFDCAGSLGSAWDVVEVRWLSQERPWIRHCF